MVYRQKLTTASHGRRLTPPSPPEVTVSPEGCTMPRRSIMWPARVHSKPGRPCTMIEYQVQIDP